MVFIWEPTWDCMEFYGGSESLAQRLKHWDVETSRVSLKGYITSFPLSQLLIMKFVMQEKNLLNIAKEKYYHNWNHLNMVLSFKIYLTDLEKLHFSFLISTLY